MNWEQQVVKNKPTNKKPTMFEIKTKQKGKAAVSQEGVDTRIHFFVFFVLSILFTIHTYVLLGKEGSGYSNMN